ncbi:protein kinase C and casein kinase substrate in neurons protein 2 isoform X1 [Salmo salar]|uniref:Protein kinase C and casein kinase substrate in neurons protein 2-like isoform X1 n=1 Tax=Salmo salar TaxID=8030 RepID=A0A1S3NAG9_SALSA|nr:protein kinase C and casein kinase substrate in neurons protein 2-like isoform X1 [Salmo salar]XP_045557913.1 protein kinase C and casein kinase substrate in neurons protein 2-like isoform X1 [Salmo salar]
MSPKMSTLPREPPEDTRMQSFWMVCKKYEKVLEDLTSYTPHYMEEMEAIFDQSQEEKKKRISFLKQAFMSIHRHLDITNNERDKGLVWSKKNVQSCQLVEVCLSKLRLVIAVLMSRSCFRS